MKSQHVSASVKGHPVGPARQQLREKRKGSFRRSQHRPPAQSNGRMMAYSSPETGFKGYTFEVGKALQDLRREVQGGLLGPLRVAAQFQRAQEQRNQAFRLWLSDVMRKERELAKKVAFTTLRRRDQMLQEVGPDWYQQLSWDQLETVNQLEAVLRADVEEGKTSRVAMLLCRLGVCPVPRARDIRKAMREQPQSLAAHERFLLALYARVSTIGKVPVTGDPPTPEMRTGFEFTPSERLLLSALAHLRLPHVLQRLQEEFGPAKVRPPYLRIIQQDVYTASQDRYLWPYLEPQPIPQTDWLELVNANHAVHLENLYIRAHILPPALVPELIPKPEQRVSVLKFSMPKVSRRKKASGSESVSGEEKSKDGDETAAPSAGAPPTDKSSEAPAAPTVDTGTGTGTTRQTGQRPAKTRPLVPVRTEDDRPAGVDPASIVALLSTLASEGDPLCQLPDVHRLPMIQKWVRMRNGLQYVHRKLAEVLTDRSLAMWNAGHAGMAYRVPSPHHGLSPRQARELTWDRREWYRRRVKRIMSGYWQALRTIQVNAAREMFPSMACDYLPSRDKFLRTYFAYMPKHERDMIVVKPWTTGEYNQRILPLWRDRYYANKQK